MLHDVVLQQFHNGDCTNVWKFLGCHRGRNGKYVFRVWAPAAGKAFLTGSFNHWAPSDIEMKSIGGGVFELTTALVKPGDTYKYCMVTADGRKIWKSDPYAVHFAQMPDTASVVYDAPAFPWTDGGYRSSRARRNAEQIPINIYEVHVGSWKKHEDGTPYSFRELADSLIPYAKEMGYTHIELLPVMEHPFEPSWGYQVTGYYAPSSRWGTPDDLKYFVNCCHQAGLGVIFDWVPGHFPKDEQGLYEFDGSPCYEPADPVMNEHPQWTTRLFDYSKPEVVSFLVSNALYWLTEYHADGLRVDAVASMLYLDFERTVWHPNRYGTNLNLDAIAFLKKLNAAVSANGKHLLTVAEESSTFPHVTGRNYPEGLGFALKWNMGWMNDVLSYMEQDPLYRKYNHNKLTFTMTYAYTEQFMLPLSHDEVVHGKKSLIGKMPGSYDEKFSNLRLLFGFQMTHPGKKLNFMGNEFGQFIEWNEQRPLDWFLLDYERHTQMQRWSRDLNHFYLAHTQLWQNDSDWGGFQWVEPDDCDRSVLAYRRIDRKGRELYIICNFCPVLREHYRLGVPLKVKYLPVLNSDDACYGGCGIQIPAVQAEDISWKSHPYSAQFTLPPLSILIYQPESQIERKDRTDEI